MARENGLDERHLRYPHRGPGYDHDLYAASALPTRAPVAWPGGAPLALWVTVSCERFPLTPNADGPRAPFHMVTPYPDYRTYTTRDYGNRVGVYRVLRALREAGVPATFFCSSSLAEHAPPLMPDILSDGHEVAALGVDMNHVHHDGLPEDEERDRIARCLDQLSGVGAAPSGWLSPGRFQSSATPRLLAEAGLAWLADWGNDDMPYEMRPGITAMPFTDELSDAKCLVTLGQREETWAGQVLAARDYLAREAATRGGRVLHLALTPYVIGQPWRIGTLRALLAELVGEGAWLATGSRIEAAWRQPSAKADKGTG